MSGSALHAVSVSRHRSMRYATDPKASRRGAPITTVATAASTPSQPRAMLRGVQRRGRRTRRRLPAASAMPVTAIATHADREPESSASGAPTTSIATCTQPRSRGFTMRSVSGAAASSMNGGVAIEPNGSPSPPMRIGGMIVGPSTASQAMRRHTITASVAAE